MFSTARACERNQITKKFLNTSPSKNARAIFASKQLFDAEGC